MIKLDCHLNFNGQCEAAFKYYEKCLGGKIAELMTWGESPMAEQVPLDWAPRVIHASFSLGGQFLSGADAPPGRYQRPQGFSVALNFTTAAEAERIFMTLSEGGSIQMPMQETFWAERFGMVVDQFGIPWMINCAKSN